MKKIININLYGRVIPIEDAAYDSLQRYIESLRRYFAAEEGRDEIINDIESRVSELMNDKIKKGSSCITEADVAEIITAMGRIEDFEAADYNETTSSTESKASSAHTNDQYTYSHERFKGRLYRDESDKFLGGVCSGIAAYVNIDPTVVRLLFAIITFGGFGLGFLLYIILWIVLPTSHVERYRGKRFFRNPDDRIIGGVAGGMAAYFNKSAWMIRLVFAAPFLLKIFFNIIHAIGSRFNSDLTFDIASGSLTATLIISYIILWIVLPEAKTPYDKMEMRGERIDVNRIKQNVQEGMNDFRDKAKDFSEEVKTAAKNFTSKANQFSKERGWQFVQEGTGVVRPVANSIGHAIGVLFKALFLFIAGVIAFALFVVVLVLTFGGVAQPINMFFLDGAWQKVFMWSSLLFFVAVPLLAILIWVIRRAMKVRSQNRYLGWVFGGLWGLGWITLPLFISSIAQDFSNTDQSETTITLAQPYMHKMIVEVPGRPVFYTNNFVGINIQNDNGWDITPDSLKLSNVHLDVQKSEDSLYHVTLIRMSDGRNRNIALQRAEKIVYPVTSVDSMLQLANSFALGTGDKFRNQRIMIEIKIPVGKQIRFDHSIDEKLNPFNFHSVRNGNYNGRRYSGRGNYNFYYDDHENYDWQFDTDYYMNTNGKLQAVNQSSIKTSSFSRGSEKQVDEESDDTNDEKPEEVNTGINAKSGSMSIAMPIPFIPAVY